MNRLAIIHKLIIIVTLLVLINCQDGTFAESNTSYIYPPWKHTWGVRRATPFKLRLFAGNKTKFNNPQGLACVRMLVWEDTTTIGDDDEVTVYGVNSGDNCIIYNRSMFSLGIYGLDEDHEKMNRPWGIAADANGFVYVVDRGNARVLHLFNPGKGLEFRSVIGGPGDGEGQFIDPCGITLDNNRHIYVTDVALGRVTVFDASGEVLDTWNGLIEPDGIAAIGPDERWTFYRNDAFVIVVDSLHQRLRKYSMEGELLAEFSIEKHIPKLRDSTKQGNPSRHSRESGNDKEGFSYLHGDRTEKLKNIYFGYAVIDYHSQILVTDRNNGCLHKFDRNLQYLTSFGKSGRKEYQFDEPRGIALHRRFGQLFVAEREGAQYFWVAVDVPRFEAKVRVDSIWRDLDVDFTLTEPALCELDVLDNYGRFLTRIASRRRFPAGKNHLSWSMVIPRALPNDKSFPELPPQYQRGKRLPIGRYKLNGRFRAVYSSRKHFEREVEARFDLIE